MIGIKEMFEIYISNLKENIITYDNMVFNLNNSKKYLLEKLIPYELYIKSFTKIKYDNIDSLKLIISIEDIVFFDKAQNQDEIINRITLVDIINKISHINIKLSKINYELNKLKERTQKYPLYKFIIAQQNKLNSSEILKGETLNLGFRIGAIRIQKKKRYKGDENVENFDPHNYKVVNWGESNKFKAELIKRSILPYKAIKDVNGKIIGDNGGHKWLMYFTDDFSYWWYWNKNSPDKTKGIHIKNAKKYSFLPTKGIKGNRVALQTLLKTDVSAHLNYSL